MKTIEIKRNAKLEAVCFEGTYEHLKEISEYFELRCTVMLYEDCCVEYSVMLNGNPPNKIEKGDYLIRIPGTYIVYQASGVKFRTEYSVIKNQKKENKNA